jgi:hypothetical protein
MAKFTFNGDETLIYSDIDGANLTAVPGQSYDISAAPDALWSGFTAPVETPVAPVEAPQAPVSDSNTPA